ncbi:MAG: hypothetical protein P8J87_05315, partial [Verrucomicrobiales bacterium]|nr:hypothetical protein [Verrucomicrobiales bacterium]
MTGEFRDKTTLTKRLVQPEFFKRSTTNSLGTKILTRDVATSPIAVRTVIRPHGHPSSRSLETEASSNSGAPHHAGAAGGSARAGWLPLRGLVANPFGLRNMHAGVREWCRDDFNLIP